MIAPPFAHAGHWLASLLYLVPVLVVVGALVWQSWRDKRRRRNNIRRVHAQWKCRSTVCRQGCGDAIGRVDNDGKPRPIGRR